jgi:3-deoxy-D-manno-octulosonate 8-phosphate phosphatase (KDO 8-P phosphatase)
MSLDLKATRIKLLLFDVDGVLTDGTVIVHSDGTESKTFGIRDGIGMVWAQRAGLKVGLLSARMSATTPHRAAQLGITIIQQGVANKLEGYERIITDLGIGDEAVAYMGDDIVDLGVLARVGFAAAPADAVREVKKQVDWVSAHPGGRGAVRELIELILRAQQRWATVVGGYAADNERVTTARKGVRSAARGKTK